MKLESSCEAPRRWTTPLKHFVAGRRAVFSLTVLVAVFALAWVDTSFAQSTVYWRSAAGNGNWANTDASGVNNWWRQSDGWDIRREDLSDGQWSASGTKAFVIVRIDNNAQTTMSVNNEGGAKHHIYELFFQHSSSRTINQSSAYIAMGGGSGNAKIESVSGQGTGTYTFNVPLALEKQTELNPVGGPLVFNANITNAGFRILVYGANTLTLGGVVSGTGGLSVLGGGTVLLTGNHTFSGITTNQSGTLSVGNGGTTGALRASVVNNSTLRFNRSDAYSQTNAISGSGTLVKQGAGTLTLTAANTYTGITDIEVGSITVSGSGTLGNGSVVRVSSGASLSANVNVSVARLSERGPSDSGTASIGSGATLTITGANQGVHYMSTLSGDGGLTMSGSGDTEMRLFQNNTFAGNLTVNSATVGLHGVNGAIPNVPAVIVGTNATFSVATRSGGYTMPSSQKLVVLASASGSPSTILTSSGSNLTTGASTEINLARYSSGGGAPLRVTGAGSLVLGSGNSVVVTNTGAALSAGSYKLIAKAGSATVSGTAPSSVTVGGSGLAAGHSAELAITSGELFLVVTLDPVAPTVTTTAASAIATTSATLGGNVTDDGGAAVTDRGIVYKASSGVTISDNKTQIGSGTGSFDDSFGSLSVNTRYYFRAYAINSVGTSLGSELDFWTLANVPSAPTVTAASSTSLSVDVNVNGNPASTQFAIRETGSGDYVQGDGSLGASAVWDTDAGWGNKTVTGLSVNTEYTFEVRARNGANVETAFGSTASRYTLANVPSAPTVGNPAATTLDVTVNVNGNPAGTQFAIRETGSGDYVQGDGSLGASAVWQTAAAWGTITVTGLTPSTLYEFEVKARNGENTETAFGTSASETTLSGADPGFWIGDGANANWGNTDNWSAGAVPPASSNAVFYLGLTSGSSINLESTYSINGVIFNSSATTPLTFGGSALTLGSGGITAVAGSTGHTFGNNLVLGSNQAWINNGSTNLTVSGIVSGSGTLNKQGSAPVVLSGNNTFDATLTISAGALRITHVNGLGSTAAGTIVSSGAVLELSAAGNYPAEALTLSGSGIGGAGALRKVDITARTYAGTITLAADAKIAVDAGGLNPSALIDLDGNTLTIDTTASFQMQAGSSFANATKTTGSGAIHKTGSSFFLLRPSSDLTGSITLSGGELRIGPNASGSGLVAGGVLVMEDGTTLRSDGNTARAVAKNVRFEGNVTLGHSGGTGALTISGNVDLDDDVRTVTLPNDNIISGIISNGGLTKAGAGRLTLSGDNSYSGLTTINAGTLQIGSGTSGTITGNIQLNTGTLIFSRTDDSLNYSGVINGESGQEIRKEGAGLITLSGNNFFEGPVSIVAGTLRLGHASALGGPDDDTTISSGATLDLNGMSGVDESLFIVGTGVGGNGVLVNNSGTASLSGDISMTGAATIGGTGNMTLSGALTGSDALTKAGAGTITFSGTKAYSGATTVGTGTLIVSGSANNSAFSVSSGAKLMGAGSVGNLTVSGVVDPGNADDDLATLSVAALNLENDGQMIVDISAMTGAAGTDWDRITASGTITVNATSGNPFVIKVQGDPTFNSATGYTNVIMAGASVSGFAADKFVLNIVDFDPDLAGGAFRVQQIGNDIALVYAPRVLWFPFTGSVANPSNVAANISVGDMAISAGSINYGTAQTTTWIGPSGVPYAQGSGGWNAGDQASAKNFNFTITADEDYIFYITGARILWRRTGTGPTDVGFTLNSTSAYASSLAADTTVWQDVPITGYDAMTNALFRVDGWGGAAGDFRIDDVELFGTVEQGPVITVTGSLADFGLVGVGDESSEQTYTVSGVRLRDDITITAPTGFEISLTSGSGFTSSLGLTPSSGTVGATTIYVKFAPGSTGAFSDNITHTSPLAVTKIQAVTGEGISAEPTTQAHTINFTAIGLDTMTVNWTSGNGANRIVVGRQGSAVNAHPADGVDYTADAEFGAGDEIGTGNFVVYNGSGSSVVVTGLNTNTTYHFRVYEYNGTGGTENYNVNTASGNPASESTLDLDPGIGRGPASINISSTLGSTPAAGSFGVTNVGGGTLTYTISTNAGWLTVSPTGASLASGNAQQHTVTYQTVAGTQPGVSNAVITITAGSATNSPQTIPVEWTINAIPNPSAATVTGQGSEYVSLSWTKDASYDVMIVHRQGAAVGALSQGTAYSVGGAAGGGTVIYKGAGSALEHIVAPGATHHYAFFSYNGNYYSSGVTDNTSLPSYAAGISVEPFAYTNTGSLATSGHGNGGTGWDGAWYGDTSSFEASTSSFANQANYPNNAGNKIRVTPPSDESRSVFRELDQVYNDGQIYVAYIMNYQYQGPNKYAGLSLFWDNSSEKLFFGEIYAADQTLGIDSSSSSYTLDYGSGNDYIIIGKYDWTVGQASVKAYKVGSQTVPLSEPGTWDLTVNIASNVVGWVNSIRIAAGAGPSSGTPGNVYFDEIRVASSWSDLLGVVPGNPDDPAAASATADGPQMVRLAWTKNGADDNVLILHKTSAITTDPTDATPYSVGATIDGATVIYNGSGTSFEHVVPAGSANYYKFYSVNGNYYSGGLDDDLTMSPYGNGIIDQFAYTNNVTLAGGNTGQSWSGAWSIGSGTWTIQQNSASPTFPNIDGYSDVAGNRVRMSNPGDNQSAAATRSFSTISTGAVYVAFMMAYEYEGANKWSGLSFFDGGTERAFFGKGGGGDWYNFAVADGSSTYFSSRPMRGQEAGSTNVYLVVGKYDIGSGAIRGNLYAPHQTLPETEPGDGSWDANATGLSLGQVNAVRIAGGASSGAIGQSWFDEVRVAQSWGDLIASVCPTWVGNLARVPAGDVYLGDAVHFKVESFPIGPGQAAVVNMLWEDTTTSFYGMEFWKFESNNTFWTNLVQMSQVGDHNFSFTVSAGACDESTPATNEITVLALPNPTAQDAVVDGVFSNSQINLSWTKNGQGHDVMVIRRTSNTSWPSPTQGQTYFANDTIGDATVVYRGAAESHDDEGLAPNTTYYYRLYSENWGYYSSGVDASATTGEGTQEITVDGNPSDWVGSPGTVINSSTISANEFIWKDKTDDSRTDDANYSNAEIREFRVYADTDDVYFLLRYDDVTDIALPYIAIGVDTRRDTGSTAMNWIGDDANTFVGSEYFGTGAAERFPEHNIIVHTVGGTPSVELYHHTGGSWYAPSSYDAAISTTHNAIEVRIPRADLNLGGSITGRFTVASYLNTGVWANDGNSTVDMPVAPDALDSISIPPYNVNDGALSLSAWAEDLSDSDVDFWFDLRFASAGVAGNTAPTAPGSLSPTNNANVVANPTLSWSASTDSDGEVTSYFLEVSTDELMNGVDGTENGNILLRVNLPASQTSYDLSTSSTQYYWRVRARDTGGALSGGQINRFTIGGQTDVEGPLPTLLYIGTDVAGFLNGDYDSYIDQFGYIQDVLDSEIASGSQFGYVLRWEDPSGVYATNKTYAGSPAGDNQFTYNIVSTDGRVSPNWDIIEYQYDSIGNLTNTYEWGIDVAFPASNTWAQGNTDTVITNFRYAAFAITNFNPLTEYFLTVSAEDGHTQGGSWATYGSWNSFAAPAPPYWGGYANDGPNTARNITTNYLIRIEVRDDDVEPPIAGANIASWAGVSMLASNTTTGLLDSDGVGQSAIHSISDADLAASNDLTLLFNVWDRFTGIQRGTTPTTTVDGNVLTNTRVSIDQWLTNNTSFYRADLSDGSTTHSNSYSTWVFNPLYEDIGELWGSNYSAPVSSTNRVLLHVYDADNDRPGDQSDQIMTMGFLQLYDDDTDPPVRGANPISIVMDDDALEVSTNLNVVLLAGWNFNTESTSVSHGSGTMTLHPSLANVTYPTGGSGGSSLNLVNGDVAGNAFRVAGSSNNGRWIQFELSMRYNQNLVMTFAALRTADGFNNNQVSWSTNGTDFTSFGSPFNPDTSFGVHTFDFSAVTALNDAETVYIRITLDGASANGANRYDNFQFNADTIYYFEITDGQLAGVDGGNPLHVSFNVYDAYSGLARGVDSATNSHINIDGLATNMTAFDVTRSTATALTTNGAATSVWTFVDFPYATIGDLYGDGTINREIRGSFSDADFDRPNDNLWLSNAFFGIVRVIDDDEDAPEPRDIRPGIAGGAGTGTAINRPFFVMTQTVYRLSSDTDPEVRGPRRAGTGTDSEWVLTDKEMANAGDRGIAFAFGAWDLYSGVSRGDAGDTNSVMSFSIGAIHSGDFVNFNAGASTAGNPTNTVLTNIWTFADGTWSGAQISSMVTSGLMGVRVTIPDLDDDRPDDTAVLHSELVGQLRVVDDDIDPPLMGALTLNAGPEHNLFVMNFDVFHGWTNVGTIVEAPQYLSRINEVGADLWIGTEFGVPINPATTPFGMRMSGSNVGAFQTEQGGGRLQMPEREELGTLFLWAVLSGDGSRSLVVEGSDDNGSTWDFNFGTNVVTATSEYQLLTWTIDQPGPMVLRLRPDDANARTVYFDDLSLVRRVPWTNVTDLAVSFDNAEDKNDIYQYRALTNGAPVFAFGTNIAQGVLLATNSASFAVPEGVITGFVFAVDNDNDRPGDRMRHAGIPYVARIDQTPPLPVDNIRATDAAGSNIFDDTIDETSEIKVEWTPPAGTEAEAAGWRMSDNQPLSPWDTYIITYHEVDDDSGTTSPADAITNIITRHTAGYSNVLNNWAFTNLVLTDLSFDSYYRICIEGQDEAGNIGSSMCVVGNTDRFIVTQGLARTSTRADIFWTAATNQAGFITREYDLIRADAQNYTDGMQLQSVWSLVGSITNSWLMDTNAITGNNMRFYRASPRGRWTNNVRPVASEEVYVSRPVNLRRPNTGRGQNWVSFPGVPDTNTVVHIFGVDLPAAPLAFTDGTVLTWYDRAVGTIATQQIYLAQGPTNAWLYRLPEILDGMPANNALVSPEQGIVVNIPSSSASTNYTFLFVGRVPTNEMVQTIRGRGTNGWANNLVSFRLPRHMHPSQMNLLESGFTGSTNPNNSDWIVRWDRVNQQPAATVYFNTSGAPSMGGWRLFTDDYPGPLVPSGFFRPDDGLLIVTRGSVDDWVWTNSIPYLPPTRFLD